QVQQPGSLDADGAARRTEPVRWAARSLGGECGRGVSRGSGRAGAGRFPAAGAAASQELGTWNLECVIPIPGSRIRQFIIVSSSADAILTRREMPQPASVPVEEGVIDVLKNVSRRPIEPTLASDLVADLGFDSLRVLEVVAELEDRFDISIPLNDVPSTRTVGQVVAQVASLVAARPNA